METITLNSGKRIPEISVQEAAKKHYLSRGELNRMHLSPQGDPIAYRKASDGGKIYYFDPSHVTEKTAEPDGKTSAGDRKAKPEAPEKPPLPVPLPGETIPKMGYRIAALYGYYTKERLGQMHYDTDAEPVAYTVRDYGKRIYFYDKATAVKRPLKCILCGKNIRYKRKLCEACFEKDLKKRRAEGDAYRNTCFGMKRERVLFFDLELTGVYAHDEILSVSICDGNGKILMDKLVKPSRKKKWKETEKIHGITPEMVENAESLAEISEEIKEIFAKADNLIAYGVSTDYAHIKYIYDTEAEREALRKKVRCAANEYVRYIQEHDPDEVHASLTDAMARFEIAWEGVAHTSIADTVGCAKVWEKLFPHYYDN